jgi:hypothetical protein
VTPGPASGCWQVGELDWLMGHLCWVSWGFSLGGLGEGLMLQQVS